VTRWTCGTLADLEWRDASIEIPPGEGWTASARAAQSDPRKPMSKTRAARDDPEHETEPGSAACGGKVERLKTADILKSADGRCWHKPAAPPALEYAAGIR
jgi:hypothetical protein